jgi:hypothetical protein
MQNEPSSGKPAGPDLGRRGLWRQLLTQAIVLPSELRGHRHLALTDLQRLPDRQLAEVVPVFRADGGFRLEAGRLFAEANDPQRRHCVYVCSDQEAYLLQRFDSGTPLADIGEELEERFRLPRGRGFALARDLFLRLAQRVICHPAGPHEP